MIVGVEDKDCGRRNACQAVISWTFSDLSRRMKASLTQKTRQSIQYQTIKITHLYRACLSLTRKHRACPSFTSSNRVLGKQPPYKSSLLLVMWLFSAPPQGWEHLIPIDATCTQNKTPHRPQAGNVRQPLFTNDCAYKSTVFI